jgi:hypothetical protein
MVKFGGAENLLDMLMKPEFFDNCRLVKICLMTEVTLRIRLIYNSEGVGLPAFSFKSCQIRSVSVWMESI